jgi:hypothetical protein
MMRKILVTTFTNKINKHSFCLLFMIFLISNSSIGANYYIDCEAITHKNIVPSANLFEFEGVFVISSEKIKIGTNGAYAITIKKVKNGQELQHFTIKNLIANKPDNDFILPKRGVYRSRKKTAELRDEAVRLIEFSIKEEVKKLY